MPPRRSVSRIIGLALIGLVPACALMTEEGCLEADWFAIGKADGFIGAPQTVFQHREDACTRYGIGADAASYHQGHSEGLKHYCQPQRALQVGLEGRPYTGVCSNPDHFLFAYRIGQRAHDACGKANALRHDEVYLLTEIEKLRSNIANLQGRVRNSQSADQRRRLQNKVLEVRADVRSKSDRLDSIRFDRVDATTACHTATRAADDLAARLAHEAR